MVALHKEHYVFPVTLAVTRVSGTGAEAMFMGVMKPAVEDAGSVKAWLMPGGWGCRYYLMFHGAGFEDS
jgi:hypothetical protein